jgi:hypothetical protein
MAVSSVFLLTAPVFGIRPVAWISVSIIILNLIFIGLFYVILFRTTSEKKLRLVFILTNLFLTTVLLALILNSLH